MRITAVLALALCLVAGAAQAGSHKHHDRRSHDERIHISHGTEIDLDGDVLVITHEGRRYDDEVLIGRDGDLRINGDRIEVDSKERRLLSRFYEEAVLLTEMAEAIEEDADLIAEVSLTYATEKVAAVLRALGDEDAPRARHADLDSDFEEKIEVIQQIAEKIENQADEVVDLSEELRDRIPELDELGWFLDD